MKANTCSRNCFVILSFLLLLCGCSSTNNNLFPLSNQPGLEALNEKMKSAPEAVKDVFSQSALISPPLLFSTNKTITVANGAKTYTVTIVYNDKDSLASLKPSDPAVQVLNLGNALLRLAPQLQQFQQFQTNIPSLASLFQLAGQFSDFTNNINLQSDLKSGLLVLISNQLSTVALDTSTNATNYVSLNALTAAYLKAYLAGNYVDRWGNPVSQPVLDQLNKDTAAAVTKILMESFFDYAYMTPVVDNSATSKNYKKPTFATLFPLLYEKVATDPDKPGVTAEELEALNFISQSTGEQAKNLSALMIRTIGGPSVGVKISTGDNDTLAQIISTLCSESLRRAAENASYKVFEQFQYTTNQDGYLPDYAANSTLKLDKNMQQAIAIFIENQSLLENLISGSKKQSP